jgi:hypothetical protein
MLGLGAWAFLGPESFARFIDCESKTTQPPTATPAPERRSAVVAVALLGFFVWVLLTFVFPVLKGGYFPGLYTAIGHLALSALLLYLLVRESKKAATPSPATAR